MNGTLIWFNADKGFGFIRTDDDERLYVAASGFVQDEPPKDRCGGRPVAFERILGSDGPHAIDVRYVVADEPRRARRRHSR